MAERSKAAVLKTAVGSSYRGFESLSLRHFHTQKAPKHILRGFFVKEFFRTHHNPTPIDHFKRILTGMLIYLGFFTFSQTFCFLRLYSLYVHDFLIRDLLHQRAIHFTSHCKSSPSSRYMLLYGSTKGTHFLISAVGKHA